MQNSIVAIERNFRVLFFSIGRWLPVGLRCTNLGSLILGNFGDTYGQFGHVFINLSVNIGTGCSWAIISAARGKATSQQAKLIYRELEVCSCRWIFLIAWISFSQLVQVIAYLAKDASEKDADQWALIKPSLESNCMCGILRTTGQSRFHDFKLILFDFHLRGSQYGGNFLSTWNNKCQIFEPALYHSRF